MECLLSPVAIAALAFATVAIVRMLRRQHDGRGWWASLAADPALGPRGHPFPASSSLILSSGGRRRWKPVACW